MIDSHCHLADLQYSQDLESVVHNARSAGVEVMITISDDLHEAESCIKIAEKYEQIFCTVGVHPHEAKHWKKDSAVQLRRLAESSSNVVAIGEIGLDYHYDNSPRDIQQIAFREQVSVAQELQLPVVLHNRDSIADMRSILFDLQPKKAVIHCCTEPWNSVQDLVEDLGYFLSFTGIATYPKSHEIRETILRCPLSQMMIETDAPYLAPVPYRGKRNEPAYVVEVLTLVAELKNISLQKAEESLTQNTKGFFCI